MMDSNKEEALRSVRFAEEAIASGDKTRALRYIKIAKRLNQNLSVDKLLAACEELDSGSSRYANCNGEAVGRNMAESVSDKPGEGSSRGRDYTEEHLQLIRNIKRNKNYYAILGVEKTCSGEEIKKAYRKLSLKVHPDKNKAPGAEEAFKIVCKAFKCLSEEESRRKYDQIGCIEESQYNHYHNNVRQRSSRRRRRHVHDLFDDDLDQDDVFRSFFAQADMFSTPYVYRSRGMSTQEREDSHQGGSFFLILVQLLPFLLIILLACLPLFEPHYTLHKNNSYQIQKTTEKHGVEFYVKSLNFDQKFPVGSSARDDIENNVFMDYKTMLWRYCNAELRRRHWAKNMPTPHCHKLNNLGVVRS